MIRTAAARSPFLQLYCQALPGNPKEHPMNICYLVLVTRTPAFRDEVGAEHARFLDDVRARGQLLLTGGFTDKSGGAYVLQDMADLAAAQALVDTDPLLVHGSATASIHEWATR